MVPMFQQYQPLSSHYQCFCQLSHLHCLYQGFPGDVQTMSEEDKDSCDEVSTNYRIWCYNVTINRIWCDSGTINRIWCKNVTINIIW